MTSPPNLSHLPSDPNVPRPPLVPGELKSCLEESMQISSDTRKLRKHRGCVSSAQSVSQKSNLLPTETSTGLNVPLDFEPEGGNYDTEVDSEGESGSLTPNYLKWAASLQVLLNDQEGLNLFREYLQEEDLDRFNMLEFWLACKGLSKQPPKQAHQLVKVIYTHLFSKAQLGIGKELRKAVTQLIFDSKANSTLLPVTTFSDACKQVEKVMHDVMYPNFLQSDKYVTYVQKMQSTRTEGYESEDKSCESEEEEDIQHISVSNQPLPVVDENKELSLPLTENALLATRRSRLTFPGKYPESCSGRYLQYGASGRLLNPYHSGRRLHHTSYNPVSRQDSEIQSLSSDARTDSMSDVSFDDVPSGKDARCRKKHQQPPLQHHHHKKGVIINQNSDLISPFIPRTQRLHQDMDKKLDLNLLNKKLEAVVKEREKVVNEIDYSSADDILEQHVNRSIRDQTPLDSLSPNIILSSDCRKLPPPLPMHLPLNKCPGHNVGPGSHASSSYGGIVANKPKHKDMGSLFSLDSGNGTDPAEGTDHRYILAKSKSMPNYSCAGDRLHSPETYTPGFYPRGHVNKTWNGSRKTLTDSGVSVMSGDYQECRPQPVQYKDKISNWLAEHERTSSNPGGTYSSISVERESNSSSKHRKSLSMTGSHGLSRTKPEKSVMDRINPAMCRNNLVRNKMVRVSPLLPQNVEVQQNQQLQEACRKLVEDLREQRNCPGKVESCPGKPIETLYPGNSHWSQGLPLQKIGNTMKSGSHKSDESSTLKGSSNFIGGMSSATTTVTCSSHDDVNFEIPCKPEEFTTVVYNFRDEAVPYRSKVPGSPITLKQFKEFMPRKGRYRYFFMTSCEDFEMKQIKEEITDDNQYLPLWKGKVMAQIESLD